MTETPPSKHFVPWRWYPLTLVWAALASLVSALTAFRAVLFSDIAQMIDMSDVPMLHFLDQHYGEVYWTTVAVAVVFVVLLVREWRLLVGSRLTSWREVLSSPASRRGAIVVGLVLGYLGIALIASRFSRAPDGGPVDLIRVGVAEWLVVVLVAICAWCLGALLSSHSDALEGGVPGGDRAPRRPLFCLAIVYLLSSFSVAIYAFVEHVQFWDPEANGGYHYEQFFVGAERTSADFVLFSTSALFSSIAALIGCLGFLAFQRLSRAGRKTDLEFAGADVRRFAVLATLLWTFSTAIPWQAKILPEIRAEDGWLMPCLVLAHTLAALGPLAFVSLAMMKRDFETGVEGDEGALSPRRSEFAIWSFLLFPVYPLVRFLLPRSRNGRFAVLTASTAVVLGTATWLVNRVEDLFDFDDWRGMIKEAQLPFLRVLFALLSAYLIYLIGRRILSFLMTRRQIRSSPPTTREVPALARTAIMTLAVVYFGLATWPFWGWGEVHRNTFARTYEFSDRHVFELNFLHWLFDYDRDGYSAVLHGADPDDFDENVHPGRLDPPAVRPLPEDEFVVEDRAKLEAFPNVLLLYFEGVVPRAISAYGDRKLSGGLVPTPHIDAIAREGTIFRNVRCFYPSTWDGWFAVTSGRFLRVSEMTHDKHFGLKYSRYNNIYKVLQLAKIDRWCHADCQPYFDLLVPPSMRGDLRTAWNTEENGHRTHVSSEEEDRGIWRGDKRNQRILEFIDDLEPGEKFFITEHMSDTHFPWERTPLERADELGFPDGLDQYEADAVLHDGKRDEKFSIYYQVITRVDSQIGQIVAKLKEKGLYDNTMVVLVGDHGCQWWEHEHLYYVSHLYEQSLRVPLIIKVPGIPGGGDSSVEAQQLDILPTIMEVAGVVQTNRDVASTLPGLSLIPLMKGDAGAKEIEKFRKRDIILLTHYDTLGIVSTGDSREHKMIKLIFDRPAGTYLMFNLDDDPMEMINLADSEPEMLERMIVRLRAMSKKHPAIVGLVENVVDVDDIKP
jgi:arylsulfatase A-like enzyme